MVLVECQCIRTVLSARSGCLQCTREGNDDFRNAWLLDDLAVYDAQGKEKMTSETPGCFVRPRNGFIIRMERSDVFSRNEVNGSTTIPI